MLLGISPELIFARCCFLLGKYTNSGSPVNGVVSGLGGGVEKWLHTMIMRPIWLHSSGTQFVLPAVPFRDLFERNEGSTLTGVCCLRFDAFRIFQLVSMGMR